MTAKHYCCSSSWFYNGNNEEGKDILKLIIIKLPGSSKQSNIMILTLVCKVLVLPARFPGETNKAEGTCWLPLHTTDVFGVLAAKLKNSCNTGSQQLQVLPNVLILTLTSKVLVKQDIARKNKQQSSRDLLPLRTDHAFGVFAKLKDSSTSQVNCCRCLAISLVTGMKNTNDHV